MNKPAIITGVALSLIAIVGLVFAGNYNSLVSSKADVDNAWAQVETQYQRRLDLIGNLVASVKGAQGQEQKVFGELADAAVSMPAPAVRAIGPKLLARQNQRLADSLRSPKTTRS